MVDIGYSFRKKQERKRFAPVITLLLVVMAFLAGMFINNYLIKSESPKGDDEKVIEHTNHNTPANNSYTIPKIVDKTDKKTTPSRNKNPAPAQQLNSDSTVAVAGVYVDKSISGISEKALASVFESVLSDYFKISSRSQLAKVFAEKDFAREDMGRFPNVARKAVKLDLRTDFIAIVNVLPARNGFKVYIKIVNIKSGKIAKSKHGQAKDRFDIESVLEGLAEKLQ